MMSSSIIVAVFKPSSPKSNPPFSSRDRGVAFGHFPAPKPQKQTHSRAGNADDIIGQDGEHHEHQSSGGVFFWAFKRAQKNTPPEEH